MNFHKLSRAAKLLSGSSPPTPPHCLTQVSLFVLQIKSKSEQEIYQFYRCWKYTKYYKTWKLKAKDRPKLVASLSDLIFHER